VPSLVAPSSQVSGAAAGRQIWRSALGARYLHEPQVQIVDLLAAPRVPTANPGWVGLRRRRTSLSYIERSLDQKWFRSCEGADTLPATPRAKAFETAVSNSAAYTIYAAAAPPNGHAGHRRVSRQEPLPGGGHPARQPEPGGRLRRCLAAAGFASCPAQPCALGSVRTSPGWRSSDTTPSGPTT